MRKKLFIYIVIVVVKYIIYYSIEFIIINEFPFEKANSNDDYFYVLFLFLFFPMIEVFFIGIPFIVFVQEMSKKYNHFRDTILYCSIFLLSFCELLLTVYLSNGFLDDWKLLKMTIGLMLLLFAKEKFSYKK